MLRKQIFNPNVYTDKMELIFIYIIFLQDSNTVNPAEELSKCKEEIAQLKSTNYKLFQFAAKEILHQEDEVT